MTIPEPFPVELIRIARKVVWFDAPEETLRDLKAFLAHLMMFGSTAEVMTVKRYLPEDEFRKVLTSAPAGIFTVDAWTRWHDRLRITPIPPLPRRHFPDGTIGPNPGQFFGR